MINYDTLVNRTDVPRTTRHTSQANSAKINMLSPLTSAAFRSESVSSYNMRTYISSHMFKECEHITTTHPAAIPYLRNTISDNHCLTFCGQAFSKLISSDAAVTILIHSLPQLHKRHRIFVSLNERNSLSAVSRKNS